MKKTIYFLAVTMLLSVVAFSSKAAVVVPNYEPVSKEAIAKMTPEEKTARIEEIKARVQEIRAMDKSEMTREQRKELRTELRSLKHEANAVSDGGVYLSVGAIIIIILLLILILH